VDFFYQHFDWIIAFGSGFLCASIIWLFLIIIRLWSDIRRTNREYLINESEKNCDERFRQAMDLIEGAQHSIRLKKQINPEWFTALYNEIPPLVEQIAIVYYPDDPEPLKAPKLGEFIRAVELASTDIADFLQKKRIGRLIDFSAGSAIRTYKKGKTVSKNPIVQACSPIYKKIRPVVQLVRYKSPLTWAGLAASNAAARVIQPSILGIVGKRAIQLYSGELNSSHRESSD
jgi:hypothetical protein|tara:strand:- start:2164 stop:2856 length:693 start_codon:yes stop_codon:yes gene_type:complete